MKNVLGWEQFNENLENKLNERENLGLGDIFGGEDTATIDRADKMLADLYANVSKKMNLKGFGKKIRSKFSNLFKRNQNNTNNIDETPYEDGGSEDSTDNEPISRPTGLVLASENREAEKKYLEYVIQNYDSIRWIKPIEARFLMSLAEKNLKENGDVKMLQDICTKINNNIER